MGMLTWNICSIRPMLFSNRENLCSFEFMVIQYWYNPVAPKRRVRCTMKIAECIAGGWHRYVAESSLSNSGDTDASERLAVSSAVYYRVDASQASNFAVLQGVSTTTTQVRPLTALSPSLRGANTLKSSMKPDMFVSESGNLKGV